ncbi:MAG: homoserine kinase [Gemmatimonadaceae bacterium]
MTTVAPGRSDAHTRVVVSVPGGIGNLGPGLDVLGCAVAGLRDEVTAEWCDAPGVSLLDAGHPELPTDPARHTSAIAAAAVLDVARRRGAPLPAPGVALTVRKALPLSGGQGGSAASAVAGAVAADALCGSVLDRTSLLSCCLLAEETVAGRHLDNIAPSLLGGIVLVRSVDPIDVVRLPIPDGLRIVLVHPAQRLRTSDARGVLPASLPRSLALHQMAQVAAIVAACYSNDLALLGRSIDDRIAEPARAPLLPGFLAAKEAAMTAGALGASISGAGPTAFALVAGEEVAERVATAMRDAYARAGVESSTRVTHVDPNGAVVKTA